MAGHLYQFWLDPITVQNPDKHRPWEYSLRDLQHFPQCVAPSPRSPGPACPHPCTFLWDDLWDGCDARGCSCGAWAGIPLAVSCCVACWSVEGMFITKWPFRVILVVVYQNNRDHGYAGVWRSLEQISQCIFVGFPQVGDVPSSMGSLGKRGSVSGVKSWLLSQLQSHPVKVWYGWGMCCRLLQNLQGRRGLYFWLSAASLKLSGEQLHRIFHVCQAFKYQNLSPLLWRWRLQNDAAFLLLRIFWSCQCSSKWIS